MFKFLVFLCLFLTRPTVFLDIEFKNRSDEIVTRRILIELFDDLAPKTVKNFRTFLSEERVIDGEKRTYKESIFHRIIPNFMIQGGDIRNRNGTGAITIFGQNRFEDENLKTKHRKGCLSMANSGPDTNGSQFFITVAETPHLDGKHVVFGQVTPETYKYVEEISKVQTGWQDRPVHPVKIVNCGDFAQEKDL